MYKRAIFYVVKYVFIFWSLQVNAGNMNCKKRSYAYFSRLKIKSILNSQDSITHTIGPSLLGHRQYGG